MPKGCLIVLSGPSGAGKGTLCKMIMERLDSAELSVSATTRAPRPGEREGVHYFFVDNEKFDQMIKNGELLEYANVFGANRYGTPKAFAEKQMQEGKDVILEIDVEGAMQVKKAKPDAVLIFIAPPSPKELEKRLRGRETETQEQIDKRLNTAKNEMKMAKEYDYYVINDIAMKAADDIMAIIRAERCRLKRMDDSLLHDWEVIL